MSDLSSKQNHTPTIGDIWREVDDRFPRPRFVRIVLVIGEHAKIQAVQHNGAIWTATVNPHNGKVAPERWAQLKRFNGKRTGYELHMPTEALR